MWLEFLRSLPGELAFQPPASAASLDEAEASLHTTLPAELRALLTESDGVKGVYGIDLLWPVRRLVANNILFRSDDPFRSLYMPFDHMLFFGDPGNGDQFAFAIDGDGTIRRSDIFVWDHENDSRKWLAPSLRLYFDWTTSGKIAI